METDVMDINLFIEGTLFKYDRERNALFQAGKPANHVALAAFPSEYDDLLIQFDRFSNEIVADLGRKSDVVQAAIQVNIPRKLFDSTESDILFFNLLSKAENRNFYLADKVTMRRIGGTLPEIAIGGDRYIVDFRWKELRCVFDSSIKLPMDSFKSIEDGMYFQAFYDVNNRKLIDPQHVKANSADIMLLEIPNELVLDPVGVARQEGLADIELLHFFPVKSDLTGKLKPLTIFNAKKATIQRGKAKSKPIAKRKLGR